MGLGKNAHQQYQLHLSIDQDLSVHFLMLITGVGTRAVVIMLYFRRRRLCAECHTAKSYFKNPTTEVSPQIYLRSKHLQIGHPLLISQIAAANPSGFVPD